jgi:hypothetical protein
MSLKPTRRILLPDKNSPNTNQIQTYKHNTPTIGVTQTMDVKLPIPDYDTLLEITKLSNQVALEQKSLEQKQLLLQTTKEKYRQKLLSEEHNIRSRVITIKKRQNIAQVVERIRQSEVELQKKIRDRMDKYKPVQKLDKNQKHNLFMALINKVTDVS